MARVRAKAKGKGNGKGDPDPMVSRPLPTGEFLQPDLKPLVPPGSTIWRGHKDGAWNGHLPPFKRVIATWSLYGHRPSAIIVLRDLWTRYLMTRGLSESDCPIIGLFEGTGTAALDVVAASGSAGASAS